MPPATATKARAINGDTIKLPNAPLTLPRADMITIARYVITPPVAGHWADNYNTHNRPVRPSVLAFLAGALTRGEWKDNGDTIRFDRDGVILDGQHRLEAVRAANIPIDAIVVTGLEPEAQTTMDIGARRSFADTLKLAGEADALHLAAIVTRAWRWQNSQMRAMSVRPSHAQLLAVLAAHPELRDALPVGLRVARRIKVAASISGVSWWLFAPIDADDAEVFFDRLCDGAGLEEGHAILALRRTLANNGSARAKLPDFVIQALFIKAWNAYREGRVVQQLKWKSGGAAPEAFPEPV